MRVHASGTRPAADVWRDYTTPSRWSSWAPQIQHVDHHGERVRVGSTGVVRARLGVRVPFVINAVDDAARTWSWTVGPALGRVRLQHGVDARADGATAWVEIGLPRSLALAYAPVARWALRRLVSSAAGTVRP